MNYNVTVNGKVYSVTVEKTGAAAPAAVAAPVAAAPVAAPAPPPPPPPGAPPPPPPGLCFIHSVTSGRSLGT